MNTSHTHRIGFTAFACLIAVLSGSFFFTEAASAMSPYENEIRQQGFFRTGLIAAIRNGQADALKALLAKPPATLKQDLEKAGIKNLSIYTKPLAGQDWCVVYFDFYNKEREDAPTAFENSSSFWTQLKPFLQPHPLAVKRGNSTWLRMEWMNHVGGAESKDAKQVQSHLVITRLHPEKELWYRTLHQTNWPGVGDQMNRSNVRHWTTFMVNIGQEIYMFSYYEYIGANMDADMALMKEDPVTQRWWTHTEPCLNPLPDMAGKPGTWSEAPSLLKLD